MEIHEILRKERRALDITQGELASRIGISLVTVNKFEKGLQSANLSTLKKICEALGYNIVLTKTTNTNENNCN